MKYFYLPVNFAANYNCGAYGAGSFNSGQVCAASTGNTGSNTGSNAGSNSGSNAGNNTNATTAASGAGGSANGGSLVNTGMQVILPLTLGVLLIAGALVLFFRKPKTQKKA